MAGELLSNFAVCECWGNSRQFKAIADYSEAYRKHDFVIATAIKITQG